MTDLTALAAEIRTRGFTIIPGFVDSSACTRMREIASTLSAGPYAHRYPKSTRVWDLYQHGQPFLDILSDNRLADLATSLLGEHYLLSDYSLNVIEPAQPVDDWHIDYPYNEMRTIVTGSILGLQCILALDDFAPGNGCTQIVPGSHQPSMVPDANLADSNEAFAVTAGALLIMVASTWHRSGFNASARPRAAALFSFVEKWIRPMSDPPAPGAWSGTDELAIMLGIRRPPEMINGVTI